MPAVRRRSPGAGSRCGLDFFSCVCVCLQSNVQGHYTIQHAWGLGTYTDSNGQIAIRHSKKDLATGMNTLLVCRALIGRKASTTGGSRGPPEGYDSGGDGACGWINVAYQDNEVARFLRLIYYYPAQCPTAAGSVHCPLRQDPSAPFPVAEEAALAIAPFPVAEEAAIAPAELQPHRPELLAATAELLAHQPTRLRTSRGGELGASSGASLRLRGIFTRFKKKDGMHHCFF